MSEKISLDSSELTNNYYISGFRFDKEGKGILCGSDKR